MHHIRRRTTIAAAVGLLLLGPGLSACGASGGTQPALGSTASASHAALVKALVFNFEQSMPTLDAGARIPSGVPHGPRGEVAMAGQGVEPLRLVTGRHGKGHGVAFPAPCASAQAKTCPKEIIEVYPETSLAPGMDDFEWGASLRLTRAETTDGSNILQKGFSVGGGSQWKLQVDGNQGHPSCVLVGMNDTQIYEVYAEVTIANGTWHDVSCRRTGDELAISVDGSKQKSALIPKDLTVAPEGPVRVGGKDTKANNDQYFGALDDIFVAVTR